jgi:hypothetical protein
MTRTKTKPAADKTAKAGPRARTGGAAAIATGASGALAAGGKAYVGGMMELGRTLGGFGREIFTEAGQHVRATFQAKNLREVGELQVAWAQQRIEMSATHVKEFADLACAKSGEVIAPIAALLKQDNAA